MNQENARSEALRTNQAFLIDGMIKQKQTSSLHDARGSDGACFPCA
jgi:hypothetical protein